MPRCAAPALCAQRAAHSRSIVGLRTKPPVPSWSRSSGSEEGWGRADFHWGTARLVPDDSAMHTLPALVEHPPIHKVVETLHHRLAVLEAAWKATDSVRRSSGMSVVSN